MLRIKIKKMFENFCCSECKSDFDEKSIRILREQDGLCVVQITCQKCGKAFGLALLGVSELDEKAAAPFDIESCPDVITTDDVIEAHKFIKELDNDWQKYIPERFQNK